jgi:hypothetical protein
MSKVSLESHPLGFQQALYRYASADIQSFAQKFRTLRRFLRGYMTLATKRPDGTIPLAEHLKDHEGIM